MKIISNLKRKIITALLIGILCFNTIPIYADDTFSTVEKTESNSSVSTTSVTEQVFLLNYRSFKVYHTSDFSQYSYGTNCVPTLICNVLSYYKSLGYNNLYSGDITQDMYNQICTDVNYNPVTGANSNNIITVLRSYAQKAGYGFTSNKYLLNLWSDVTRDLKLGYPLILGYGDHAYLVLGYRVLNGTKQIYTCTNWNAYDGGEYLWLDFTSGMNFTAIHIYLK